MQYMQMVYFHSLSNLARRGNKQIRAFSLRWKQVGLRHSFEEGQSCSFLGGRLQEEGRSVFHGMDVIFGVTAR